MKWRRQGRKLQCTIRMLPNFLRKQVRIMKRRAGWCMSYLKESMHSSLRPSRRWRRYDEWVTKGNLARRDVSLYDVRWSAASGFNLLRRRRCGAPGVYVSIMWNIIDSNLAIAFYGKWNQFSEKKSNLTRRQEPCLPCLTRQGPTAPW